MAITTTVILGRRSATPPTNSSPEWQVGRVEKIIQESPQAKTFWLDLPERLPFFAGQHLEVRLTAANGYQASRNYSIANSPLEPGLAISVLMIKGGEVSSYLDSQVKVGDQIEIRYPIGYHFIWDSSPDPVLLVAGGSGVVPLGSMLRHHQLGRGKSPMRLLYSARSYQDLFYKDFLFDDDFQRSGRQLAITLTDQAPPDWHGYTRRIDRQILTEVIAGLKLDELRVYICGPTSMVEAISQLAVQGLGLDPLRVKTERFGPTGPGH
jgi:ferredoxin-NADP reductase